VSTTLDLAPPAVPVAPRISQGTTIEQSRAVAEVQAAAIMARQFPRDEQRAIRTMQEACARPSLAKIAFYRYRRGGEVVTGPTVKLLQELARIWGNVAFGIHELSIDHTVGESEMLAYAWDLEGNTRSSQTTIVQHVRDKNVDGTKVAERLVDRRDVYEANTNNAARRLREALRRVLPGWFVEEAEERCRHTLENPGDGLTLAQRVAKVLRGLENGFNVDRVRAEAHVGKPAGEWTAWDLAQLTITAESIKRGDLRVDEAFPLRATRAEVTGATTPAPAVQQAAPNTPAPVPVAAPEQPAAPTPAAPVAQQPAAPIEEPAPAAPPAPVTEDVPPPVDEPPAPEEPPARQQPAADTRPTGSALAATRQQVNRLAAQLSSLQVTSREARLDVLGTLIGHRLVSSNDLTRAEATTVIDLLERICAAPEPARALDQLLVEMTEAADTGTEGGA